jgi:cobalt-zinc-cadmium efflux system membrane fusion protein
VSHATIDSEPAAKEQRTRWQKNTGDAHPQRMALRRRVVQGAYALAAMAAIVGGWWYFFTGRPAHVATSNVNVNDIQLQDKWDGRVHLSPESRAAIGVTLAPVQPQTEPIPLELLGTTKYDEETLSRVRPMLKGRVDKVYAAVGQTVHKGEPLIDLYSTDLAEAKSNYEIAMIHWTYTKNLLENRTTLQATGAIPAQLIRETQSNELRDRREYDVARDKLLVLGMTEDEIDKITDEVGQEKAHLTLRSPADGIVIERNVVPGNLYDESETLFVISKLDHLWVWGNVFESDLHLVQLGQPWDIEFPFLGRHVPCKVEYISNRVDPGTHAIRIRASVPNPDGLLKSDMLVRGILSIPAAAGRTVIPRTSVVVADGKYYAFVPAANDPSTFDRREISVVYERADYVVVDKGLTAGEEVVTTGALFLAQKYDDLSSTHPGEAPKVTLVAPDRSNRSQVSAAMP